MDRAPLTLSTHFCFVTPTPTTTLEERNVTGTGGRKGMTVTVTPHTKKSPTRERERKRVTTTEGPSFSLFFLSIPSIQLSESTQLLPGPSPLYYIYICIYIFSSTTFVIILAVLRNSIAKGCTVPSILLRHALVSDIDPVRFSIHRYICIYISTSSKKRYYRSVYRESRAFFYSNVLSFSPSFLLLNEKRRCNNNDANGLMN